MAAKRGKLSLSQEDLLMRGGVLRKVVAEVDYLGIMVYDRKGLVTEVWSDALLERRFGISGDRAIGKNLAEILPAAEAMRKLEAIEEVFATGKVQHLDSKMTGPEGDLWLSSTLFPWTDDAGEVKAVINMARDATEREQAKARCEEYHQMLTETLDEWQTSKSIHQKKVKNLERLANLGKLSAAIAHEINNPISNIMLSTELALKNREEPELVLRALQLIERNAQACKQIIESILNLIGSTIRNWEVGRIDDVVREAEKMLAMDQIASACEVRVDMGDALPALSMDAVALRQAVLNLMRNAIAAGADEILISTRREQNDILIEVNDNGRGMNAEQVRGAFSQDIIPKPESSGTGLGLSIVEQIIQLHGGDCDLESREGQGTTITLRVPVTTASSTASSTD